MCEKSHKYGVTPPESSATTTTPALSASHCQRTLGTPASSAPLHKLPQRLPSHDQLCAAQLVLDKTAQRCQLSTCQTAATSASLSCSVREPVATQNTANPTCLMTPAAQPQFAAHSTDMLATSVYFKLVTVTLVPSISLPSARSASVFSSRVPNSTNASPLLSISTPAASV